MVDKTTFTINDAYLTDTFRLLAQGMKDRHALDIVISLAIAGLPEAFEAMERYSREELRKFEETYD